MASEGRPDAAASTMDLHTFPWFEVAAITLLIFVSAFFSGSETALTAASRARLHQHSRRGNRRADMVSDLKDHSEQLIGAILIGNNIANIFASALATSLLIAFFGERGVAVATIGMTLIVVIFAEVLPKTYAINNADSMALRVAPALRVVVFALKPFTLAVRLIVRGTLRLFGITIATEFGHAEHEEELRGLIELHGTASTEEEVREERAMLRSILDLDDVWVEEIMTHRRNVVMIDADAPIDKILDAVMDSPYTRVPLYRGEQDEIIGVLHAKALLKALRERHGDTLADLNVLELAATPWFIPESTTLLDQLQEFRRRREHFAAVVDEYGTFRGVVTLEDILEEIVGDISDEHDVQVAGVRPQPDGSFVVDGTVTIRDLNREFDWRLPDEDASTVAGLVLHAARVIPNVGQEFVFYGFRFKILRRHRNQITLLRLTRVPGAQAAASGEA